MVDFLANVAETLIEQSSIFTKISELVDRCKGLLTSLSFFWFFKGRCHGNESKSKNRLFSRTNLLCRAAIRKRIAISQFRFRKVHHNELLYIVYNFGDIRSRNPRVHDVNKSTFCSNTSKIDVSCQISQNILDLLYRFVRRISMDDFPSIRLAVAQGTLLWQPVKYGRCVQTFLFASTFDNGMANRKSAFNIFNGNNQATSFPNFVNFRPVISEFTLLKCAIFAAICPQFDEGSSFVTLAFPIGKSQFWFQHSRNLVRFGSVTAEFKT